MDLSISDFFQPTSHDKSNFTLILLGPMVKNCQWIMGFPCRSIDSLSTLGAWVQRSHQIWGFPSWGSPNSWMDYFMVYFIEKTKIKWMRNAPYLSNLGQTISFHFCYFHPPMRYVNDMFMYPSTYWCVLRRVAGWVAGGCWDYYW